MLVVRGKDYVTIMHVQSRTIPESLLWFARCHRQRAQHQSSILHHHDRLEIPLHVRATHPFGFLIVLTVFEWHRYNKYASITAKALRAALKEEERVIAEKRGLTSTRFQKWENGVGGQQVRRVGAPAPSLDH